jgi:hypothetical protein
MKSKVEKEKKCSECISEVCGFWHRPGSGFCNSHYIPAPPKKEQHMKYLFSIKVEADSEAEAIEKFQDENINPADMDIEEIEE